MNSALHGDELDLVLIDLHRTQIRPRVPERWVVKDLGGLLFSALDCGLTKRDLLWFAKIYRQKPLCEIISAEKNFWRKVSRNAEKLYRKFHKKEPPPLPLVQETTQRDSNFFIRK